MTQHSYMPMVNKTRSLRSALIPIL